MLGARLAALLLGATATCRLAAQATDAFEQPPINYSSAQPRDAVARIQARMAVGEIKWTGGGKEVLVSLLRELGIPVESQLLVFSKTSFQRPLIRPDRPRALYFSDTSYVGWVPSGLIELATIDPQLGPIFYSFDPNATDPQFLRNGECLSCHGGLFVRGIPGLFARSLFTDKEGEPLLRFGSTLVDFRTPFTNRWGGWYVTGTHGKALHRGNVLALEKNDELIVDLNRGANLSTVPASLEVGSYPAPGSDIIALLVFEHQMAMQNTLTRASLNCRRMLAYQKNLQQELKEPLTDEPTYDSVKHVFESAANELVNDLLYKDEAPLPDGLAGSAAFQNAFRGNAPRARDASSLKDFHLKGRLFQNRCSYLIYSESFLTLPDVLKRRVYDRLIHALRPSDPDPDYAYLDAGERLRISRILTDTHEEYRRALERPRQ